MKKTQWFSAEMNPVRPGWYEVYGKFAEVTPGPLGVVRRYWDGRNWKWHSIYTKKMESAAVSPVQDKWRGLTKPAKGES